MPTLIEEFGSVLEQISNLRVEYRLAEVLVTVSLAERRTQTVKIVSHRGRHGPYNVLQFISRAWTARDPKMIRSALRTNAGNELGGLALDTSTNPALLDVVYNVVVTDDLP